MTTHEGFTAHWSPAPNRESIWVGLLIATTLALMTLLFATTLHADRTSLVASVERDRAEQLDHVVSIMTEDVRDVVADLELLTRIAAPAGPPREAVEAVLAGIPAYRAVEIWTDSGRQLSVIDPRRGAPGPEIARTMREIAIRLRTEDFDVSGIVADDGALYRVFGLRTPGGTVAVLAVDTSAWLSGLRLVSSDPSNHVLVIGPSGRIAPATDATIVSHLPAALEQPDVAALQDAMLTGGRGTTRLSAESAAALGLHRANIVVAYAPIRLRDDEFWSVASLTSVSSLEEQEAALIQRFALTMAGLLALMGGFAAHVVSTTKRTAVLRERLAHAAELAEMNAQLLHAEKLATVGGLSAGIAHEIGTPLGVIRGRAEYVLKKLDDDHPQSASLRTIIEQIDRVTRIVRELLDYARPRPASGKPTSLEEVLNKATALLAPELAKGGVKLTVDVSDGLPDLNADPDQLQQVLINLIINARDACADGDTVWVTATRVDRGICIEVRDEGSGIADEFLHQIFDPFFTTKKRGHGTGLGLAVVSQIVRSHAGEVEVDSASGEGTTFRIYWPAA